jgi:glycerol-3-phosphate cytidylyltransferase
MIIGYTSGVYDLFHIGHLTMLKNAKAMCDRLVVGVTTDELVSYKGKQATIKYSDRAEIVRSVRYVDAVIPQENMNKTEMCKKLKASYLFVGDDWYNTPKWDEIEEELAEIGTKVVYFPYTKGISTTMLTDVLQGGLNSNDTL